MFCADFWVENETELIETITKKCLDRKGVTFFSSKQLKIEMSKRNAAEKSQKEKEEEGAENASPTKKSEHGGERSKQAN